MSDTLPSCPQPPDWHVPWDVLETECPWFVELRECEQDRTHHGEGDVATHTRMVCEALAALPAWRELQSTERRIVFAAALLHDVAKPACRRVEPAGRVSFPGHSRRGAVMARNLLWRRDVPFALRESVCSLVRHHLKPFFLADHPDSRRVALEVSQTARCDWLALLAEADARGRLCADTQRLVDNVHLFAGYCAELGCLERAWPFPSDHARFLYFRDERRSPDFAPHEEFSCDVMLLSGLPASGKDRWQRLNLPDWPVVSLDALRSELDVDPDDAQGVVVQAAREQARQYLRDRRSFVWNATNLSRLVRGEVIRLLAAYRARVRIVYLETSAPELRERNRSRPRPVPEKAIERMLGRWEVPDLTEAHQVEHFADSSSPPSDPRPES